jgi:hypothetical protein
VDYMETVVGTSHGNIVRDWDFGSPEEFPRPRRLSSLIPGDLRSTMDRLRRGRGHGGAGQS